MTESKECHARGIPNAYPSSVLVSEKDMKSYLGDDMHLEEYEDGHIRIDCWCEPELRHLDGDNYVLHKNEKGETIETDPDLAN